MPTRTNPWPAGTPCWADNHVSDLAAARAFYGAVLGWEIDDPDTDAGNFACARSTGRPAAGFLVGVDGAQPGWHVYFASEDSAATAAAIERHGGTSLFGPHDVGPDRGRFQLASDPAGAVFGIWQAGSLTGVNVYGEHGALGWQDLRTRRPTVARSFYENVFGLATKALREAGPDYTLFYLAADPGVPLGGIGGMADQSEAESHWVPYFMVDDIGAAIVACTRTGGAVSEPARDSRWGPMATLADPFGARFSIITPSSTSRNAS